MFVGDMLKELGCSENGYIKGAQSDRKGGKGEIRWQFQDCGEWRDMAANYSNLHELFYKLNQRTLEYDIPSRNGTRKYHYVVDLDTKEQENQSRSTRRRIRRTALFMTDASDFSVPTAYAFGDDYPEVGTSNDSRGMLKWQYEEIEGAEWKNMTPHYSNEHEKKYRGNEVSFEYEVSFPDGSSYDYFVDLTENTQLNKNTNTVRKIRRICSFRAEI